MKDIKEITKNTLSSLKDKRLPATPENYFLEFVAQAKLLNNQFDDIKILNDALKSLTNDEKKILNNESIFQIIKILSKRATNDELKSLISTFSELLAPSINFELKEDIEDFILVLLKNPKNITTRESINKIKEFAQKRIDADRRVLKEKTNDIIKLTSLMSRYYDKTLSDSDSSNEEIQKIKDDLVKLEISDYSKRELIIVQKKLIDTIYRLENSLQENNRILSTNIDKFKLLHKQIEELEKELKVAKEEYHFDFLTGILNRRAYDNEAKKMEKQYFIFDTNFAVVFFDIDHFKKINDNFGHICGDEILKSFAIILKDLTRKEDVVARYGGEEFVALINFRDKIEVKRYIKRVKNTFLNSTFIYKDYKINITFSAGVTFRNNYNSIEEAHNKADELLYQAKKAGRDKTIFDSGEIV
ncbi:GGDEF domain-containing protein [Aliarcobacter vitoriensis]|uniref:diguanylate cyclase n=1 Tax=Aliarcobacter vitoriensis TaxID=2011099 RepID=A0A366MUP8_9BACT|nr:GGDEF domain-containing protein [Aliarcobacter vitoriensis]RBQ29593.1 GGDEF domain-containing protein [Aliarcobacter vitoriensis]